jgi:two-component system, NarL family, sensor histidine kinase DesK
MANQPPVDPTTAGFPGARGGWRRYVFPGIWLVYLAETVAGVRTYSHGWVVAVGVAIVVAFAVAYLAALPTAWSGSRARFWVAYTTMLGLYVAATPLAHQHASAMLVYLAVLTMSQQLRFALPMIRVFAAAAAFGPALVPAWHTGVQGIWLVTIPLVALAMWGFFGIMRSNRALAAARAEVARLAAENERTRIARDMHDLLGQSLTAITVKAGLARRLAEVGEADRAAAEIGEVERLSRRALADVRAAVAGHRDITLTGELATSREVLRASGILAELPGSVDIVDPALSELFGWVVREGITNVVRHSRATHCVVTLGPGWIEIADDGRGGAESGGGTGLTGLRERVAAAGGTVDAGPAYPGWRLRVEVPIQVEPARPDPAAAPTIGA